MGFDVDLMVSQAGLGLCIEILYRSEGDSGSTWRVVEPYSINDIWEGRRIAKSLFFAWDIEKDDHIRSYDISKIEDTKVSLVISALRFPLDV